MLKRSLYFILVFALPLILRPHFSFAQDLFELDQRVEEEYRHQLQSTEDKVLQGAKPFLMDWGGWNTFYYANFNGYDAPSGRNEPIKNLFYDDMRLWTKMTYRADRKDPNSAEQSLYIRVKQRMTWEDPGKGDYDNFKLDLGYITLQKGPVAVRFGEQFIRVGRGIAYQDISDGFDVRASLGKWRVRGFAAKTRRHEHNIDDSAPGDQDEQRRYFFGSEVEYNGFLYHRPYAYVVVQKDKSRENPDDTTANYQYDSQYYGIGSQGQLGIRNLRYWSELIGESGHSYMSASTDVKPIRAWAVDAGVSYYFDHPIKPQVHFEYMYGSGDSSRSNVTDTTGGNLYGRDSNFLYFGNYATGYATNFRISNIHIFRMGLSAKPLNLHPTLKKKDVTTGLSVFFYQKAKAEGGISNTDANGHDANVGEELDFFVDWRITSDLLWSLKFGAFNTGTAFTTGTSSNDSNLKFVSTNLTLTF